MWKRVVSITFFIGTIFLAVGLGNQALPDRVNMGKANAIQTALAALSEEARDQLMAQAYAEAQRRIEIEEAADKANSLIDFTTQTFPAYIPEPAHRLIGSKLDGVVRGEITRLMFFAPPQHGKSELVSVRLPAFWFGKRPNDPIILASYGASLAETHSREARNLVEDDEYKRVFPAITTSRESRSVSRWQLTAPYRGSLRAAGIDGGLTGHGAMLGILDDPHENWEEAQSPTRRETVWKFFTGTFYPRVWEGGAIVIIMTRWHEDDLAGRILNSELGRDWEVLRLPALAETQEDRETNCKYLNLPIEVKDPLGRESGEALCPARFSAETLQKTKTVVGPIVFGAEYQGVPRAIEGNRFKRAWFPIVDAVPFKVRRIRYWDKAGSTENKSPYTVGLLMAYDEANVHFYIEDVVRGRWTANEREKVIKQTAELDAEKYRNSVKHIFEQEPGSGGKESAENTIKNLAGFAVERDLPSGDKDTRLEPFAAQAEAGNVSLLRGAWNGEYIEEMTAIPNGGYRDQGDASAGAFNKLFLKKKSAATAQSKGLYGGGN